MFPRRTNDAIEDWDVFVLRHRNMNNVAFHFVSAFMFWFGPILGFFVNPYFWLFFFLSGAMGAIGHYIFKDSVVDAREATSSHADHLLFAKFGNLSQK